MIPITTTQVVASLKQVWQLEQHLSVNPTQLRRIVVISTLFFTGCRVQEVCNLRQRDVVASDDGMVNFYVRSLKSGRVRIIPARSSFLVETLQSYRSCWPASSRSPFIFTVKQVAPYPRLLHRIVKAAFPNHSPHSFRHHYATLLASQGVHMPVIQYLLGHRHLNTTSIYLATLATGPAADVWARVDSNLKQSDFLQSRTLSDKDKAHG